jgi:hypothetical protein
MLVRAFCHERGTPVPGGDTSVITQVCAGLPANAVLGRRTTAEEQHALPISSARGVLDPRKVPW